ncbi:MAG TPA: hypothetical protein VMV92_15930 [Streptosporangiaceae bacterium]|nr:hypothetical protein [Streptosporangiaceae bacterium]
MPAGARQLGPAGGLPVISPRRIAAFSAARSVARIRFSIAAGTGDQGSPDGHQACLAELRESGQAGQFRARPVLAGLDRSSCGSNRRSAASAPGSPAAGKPGLHDPVLHARWHQRVGAATARAYSAVCSRPGTCWSRDWP